jgi:hypothetical protein
MKLALYFMAVCCSIAVLSIGIRLISEAIRERKTRKPMKDFGTGDWTKQLK